MGSGPDPDWGEKREEHTASYTSGDWRRDRAGRSESAREEMEGEGEERMEERARMRARALEMDSHHDCIGSWLMGLELEFASVEVEDDGEPDACFTWNSMAADDGTGVDGALDFSAKKRIYLNKGLYYFLS